MNYGILTLNAIVVAIILLGGMLAMVSLYYSGHSNWDGLAWLLTGLVAVLVLGALNWPRKGKA